MILAASMILFLFSCEKKVIEQETVIQEGITYKEQSNLKFNELLKPEIDLNNDQLPDFKFVIKKEEDAEWKSTFFNIVPLCNAEIIGIAADVIDLEKNIEIKNTLINDSRSWKSQELTMLLFMENKLQPIFEYKEGMMNLQKGYIGVRLSKAGKYHYGYVQVSYRLNELNKDEFLIKSTAIQNYPNKSILTGQKQ